MRPFVKHMCLVAANFAFAASAFASQRHFGEWRGKTLPRESVPERYLPAGVLEDPADGGDYFGYFDNPDVHYVTSRTAISAGRTVRILEFEYQSTRLYVLNFADGATAKDGSRFAPATVRFDGTLVWQPVWVDLMSGAIATVPQRYVGRVDGKLMLKDIPVSAEPVMVAPGKLVPRRVVWSEMTPVEIVDSIYMPWQNPQGTNKGPVKMDVSKEPWAKMDTARFLPCFDRYGQFKHRDWPGKTRSDADLKVAAEAEEKDLAKFRGPKWRNRFGGWTKGPKLKATGRFRTEKFNGKWWFVDPEGRLFWSFGPVRISTRSGITPLDGNTRTPRCGRAMPDRDCLFEQLPPADDPLGAFLIVREPNGRGESRHFNFSAANLFRKYGENWFGHFASLAHRRLRSWGMNTIANGSEEAVCHQRRTPYVERLEINARKIKGSWGLWNKFHDPFDPSFVGNVTAALKERESSARDPWCIGFFAENEIQWGRNHEDLARWTLWSPDDQPAKEEFVRRLAAKGISFDAKNPSSVPVEELRSFSDAIAETYFAKMRESFRSFDPQLLYLGCRFAGLSRPDWVMGIAAKYCDVLSYNVYRYDLDGWTPGTDADVPVIIGEFHFGAHDRGLFGSGQRNALSQQGRAAAIKRYVGDALANPRIVGAHWHQYSDQATSGRFDGEHFQVGLTDICDRPYPETVKAIREVAYPMYETRMKGKRK